MKRRHFLSGLAPLLAACGADSGGPFQEAADPSPPPPPVPCPACDPDKVRPEPVVLDPPALPVVMVETLNLLSYGPADPARAVQVLAEAGVQGVRVLTVLSRWSLGDSPTPGWYVCPLERPNLWLDRRDAFLEECERQGMIAVLCLFDEPERWNRPEVIDALRGEVIDVAQASTWLDADPGWPEARELAEFYLDGVQPRPGLYVQCTNEPADWVPGYRPPPEDQLSAYLRGRGFLVGRVTGRGDDGPYSDADLLSEHAWGPPGLVQPFPPYDRMVALRQANPGARLVVSSDGFGIDGEPDQAAFAGEVLSRGYSFSGLIRRTPDRWGTEQRRAVERMVGSLRVGSSRAA